MTSNDYVLLHGAWHCGSTWGRLVSRLRHAGHRALTVELPGHGPDARFPDGYFAAAQDGLATAPTTLPEITLDVATAPVLETLRDLRERGEKQRTVLVSHSGSGAVASKVAESAPELVDHLVYVTAMAPSVRRSASELADEPELAEAMAGLLVADPTVVGAFRINPRSADPAYRATMREAFYNDLPPAEADAYLNLLSPDQPLSFLAEPVTVTSERWGSIPRTFIRTAQDRSIPPSIQDIIIGDADQRHPEHPFDVVEIDSGHSPFASQPERLAEILAAV